MAATHSSSAGVTKIRLDFGAISNTSPPISREAMMLGSDPIAALLGAGLDARSPQVVWKDTCASLQPRVVQ